MSEIQPASEGRIVHVRTPGVSHCQPAIVVRNWSPLEPRGTLNCQIFRDGGNDAPFFGEDRAQLTTWGTSIAYAEADAVPGANRTWHWPERV